MLSVMKTVVRMRGKMRSGHASGVAIVSNQKTEISISAAMIARKPTTVKGGVLCHHPG
jgi:hypothetical protein